ncbi:HD-GYP domain-containing protein [Paenibacillus chartarius]|uniref:HD-GYP domain-containing protein n=1 Tax=Paenibacillus chartarius TaxID=747481 RepID=A0ABV6DTH6_9BACL
MAIRSGKLRSAAISVLLCINWLTVYVMNGTSTPIAPIFYCPIILASRFWGVKGGIITAIIAGIICGPIMPDDVSRGTHEAPMDWFIRLFFFMSIGIFTGRLFAVLDRKHKEIVQQKNEIEKQRNDLKLRKEENKALGTGIIEALAQSLELRDSYTSGHSHRVSYLSVCIGARMGLDQQELLYVKWSSMLHDIGKIGISEDILNKTGKLTAYEYDMMKQHPRLGAKILAGIPYADRILDGVLHHHERLDGQGYPFGLSGDNIGLQARIIAVCDVWDAITSKRSYRDVIPHHEALNIMESGRGTQFDPVVLDHFLEIVNEENNMQELKSMQCKLSAS